MQQDSLQFEFCLEDEAASVAWGVQLAAAMQRAFAGSLANTALSIYLQGDLGAGKTTLCRGIVQGCGHIGAVKSPTYTLVEPYELGLVNIYHFDLYRLESDTELEFIGIDNYFNQPSTVCLFEWPERALAALPAADLTLALSDSAGRGQPGAAIDAQQAYASARKLQCTAASSSGRLLLTDLAKLCGA
ncbi:MAG: tRNA (adenosine(37)-N6)-threonylcarbamoyltransferase complex ATPase subunit type 1 TsaE [Pseudomonadales bacterium]|nr:tRNA (adenosine(37)-N6)-threonylcarbamoyltransferase complex ATPase subunit type 1 TsaE [Pseudomonadales bacterium]